MARRGALEFFLDFLDLEKRFFDRLGAGSVVEGSLRFFDGGTIECVIVSPKKAKDYRLSCYIVKSELLYGRAWVIDFEVVGGRFKPQKVTQIFPS